MQRVQMRPIRFGMRSDVPLPLYGVSEIVVLWATVPEAVSLPVRGFFPTFPILMSNLCVGRDWAEGGHKAQCNSMKHVLENEAT